MLGPAAFDFVRQLAGLSECVRVLAPLLGKRQISRTVNAKCDRIIFFRQAFVLKAMRGRIALLKHFPHTGEQAVRNSWKNSGQFAESGVFSLFASNRAM